MPYLLAIFIEEKTVNVYSDSGKHAFSEKRTSAETVAIALQWLRGRISDILCLRKDGIMPRVE